MKITISKSPHRNVSTHSIWLFMALILTGSPACSTVEHAATEAARQSVTHTVHDSICLHDSVFVRIRADTVYMEKWHTRWRERTVVRTDTLVTEKIQTNTERVRFVPPFYRYCAAVLACIILCLAARLVWRIARKY